MSNNTLKNNSLTSHPLFYGLVLWGTKNIYRVLTLGPLHSPLTTTRGLNANNSADFGSQASIDSILQSAGFSGASGFSEGQEFSGSAGLSSGLGIPSNSGLSDGPGLLKNEGPYLDYDPSRSIECRLKGKRGKNQDSLTFLLAGDYVLFNLIDDRQGLIIERIERKNSLVRFKNDSLQPIAVNLDALIIVASIIQPSISTNFIDKMIYIALCEKLSILLILNKVDLLGSEFFTKKDNLEIDLQRQMDSYQEIGVHLLYTSTLLNLGIKELKDKIEDLVSHNLKSFAIVGQSGVGKSSLINSLVPQANRKTGDISIKYNRGKHVTNKPELIFADNYCIIDTPGIRDIFSTHNDSTSLIAGFPDIFKYAKYCKLPNCSHRTEPDCAIIPRLGSTIVPQRYESYIGLMQSIEKVEKTKWNRQKR